MAILGLRWRAPGSCASARSRSSEHPSPRKAASPQGSHTCTHKVLLSTPTRVRAAPAAAIMASLDTASRRPPRRRQRTARAARHSILPRHTRRTLGTTRLSQISGAGAPDHALDGPPLNSFVWHHLCITCASLLDNCRITFVTASLLNHFMTTVESTSGNQSNNRPNNK